jgi:hypothetical protein
MELILSYGADGTIFATSLRGNQLVRQWHGISCCREGLCTVRSNTFLSGDHQLIVGINNKVFMWKWEQVLFVQKVIGIKPNRRRQRERE